MFAPAGLFVIEDMLDVLLLGSFFFGLVFVVLSLVLGAADLDIGHDHAGSVGAGGHDAHWIAQLNVGSVLAFFTWFGGVAYLCRNAAGLPAVVSVAIGLGGGYLGGALVFKFVRMLRSSGGVLDARTEQYSGRIARISSSIRAGGVGEIVYELNGVRQVSAARAANGEALPRGTDVLVLQRDRGMAIVESWTQDSAEHNWERRFEEPHAVDQGNASPPGNVLEDAVVARE
jgi:membrane protein implicated in regulation of membrane protease activity